MNPTQTAEHTIGVAAQSESGPFKGIGTAVRDATEEQL